jgi:hypothetical protein
MGDDPTHEDPTIGPYHPPGADVGVSVTFDSSGRPTQLGFDVPGTAQGSDQATIDLGGGHHEAPADPGWMPNLNPDPPLSIMDLPPPEGFHWDPITHIAIPNAVGDAGAAGSLDADSSYDDASGDDGYGDYPEQSDDSADV